MTVNFTEPTKPFPAALPKLFGEFEDVVEDGADPSWDDEVGIAGRNCPTDPTWTWR